MSSVRRNNNDSSLSTGSARRESIISVGSSSDGEEGNESGIEIVNSQINSIRNTSNNNNNNSNNNSNSTFAIGRISSSSVTANTRTPSTNQDDPEVISLSDDEIMVTSSATNRGSTTTTRNSSRMSTPINNNNNNNNNNRNVNRINDGGDDDEILIVGEGELGQEGRDRFARNRNHLTQQWQQQQRQQFEQRLHQRIQQRRQDHQQQLQQQQQLPGFFSLHLPGNTIFLPTDGSNNNNNNNLRRSTRRRQVVQPPIENASTRRRNLRQQTNNQYGRPLTEITIPFGQRSAYRQLLESFDQANNGGNTNGVGDNFDMPQDHRNWFEPSDNIARRTRGGAQQIPVALRRAGGDVLNFINAFGQYLPINPNEYEGFAGRMGEAMQGVIPSFPGGGGESDSIPMHIMDQIRQTEEREESIRLDKRKQVANNIKKRQEESNKIAEDEKEFFCNGISDKFDSICVLCGVVLGKGIPDDWNFRDGPKELTIEDLKTLVLNEKIPCPWQAIKGITELDKDLSKKVFFSKCGHVYCGRCINNISRNNNSNIGLGKSKNIDKLVQRRKKRKNFDKLGDSISLKTIEFDSPEYSSPNSCVAPNCKRKFIGKYSFKQIYI